jgi:hypothetical protein
MGNFHRRKTEVTERALFTANQCEIHEHKAGIWPDFQQQMDPDKRILLREDAMADKDGE